MRIRVLLMKPRSLVRFNIDASVTENEPVRAVKSH